MSCCRGKKHEFRQCRASSQAHWLLLAAIVLLLAASASQGRPGDSHRDNSEQSADNYRDGDGDDDDDENESENATGTDVGPVGASRGWGGTDRTWNLNIYPWIHVLFRNPDPKFENKYDGYPTGFAIELTHNVFLAQRDTIERSGIDNGLRLMGMKRAIDLKYLDPTVSRWGEGSDKSPIGIWNRLYNFADGGYKDENFGIYELVGSGRLPPWVMKPKNGTRQFNPKPVSASKGEYRYYPYLSRDKYLIDNCYLYTFAAPDWPDLTRAISEFWLPPPTEDRSGWRFRPNERRYFTRWPLKLRVECDPRFDYSDPRRPLNQRPSCVFVFDEGRYMEENNQNRYNAKRGKPCLRWQDVGAPILCGNQSESSFFSKRDDDKGPKFEKERLHLAFVVRPPIRRGDPDRSSGCQNEIPAMRLAESAEEIWKKVLYPYNCKYIAEYLALDPTATEFPYGLTDSMDCSQLG